jgi:hypothetical protein
MALLPISAASFSTRDFGGSHEALGRFLARYWPQGPGLTPVGVEASSTDQPNERAVPAHRPTRVLWCADRTREGADAP